MFLTELKRIEELNVVITSNEIKWFTLKVDQSAQNENCFKKVDELIEKD